MTDLLSRAAGFCAVRREAVRPGILLAGLLATACVPAYPPPQQVQSSNPSVTYKYHTDQDLLDVNRSAATFCDQYQSVAQASAFSNDPDGSKVIAYQCVHPLAAAAMQPAYNPNLTYNYRSDRELLAASQSAQNYCRNDGGQRVVSTVASNPDGTRTATFQCSP